MTDTTTRLHVTVTWHGDYYQPNEHADLAQGWIEDAFNDRDDNPQVQIAQADAQAPHAQGVPDLAPVIAHQWSVRTPDGHVEGNPLTEAAARRWADVIGGEVVYRAVGPWQPADRTTRP